VYVKIYKHIFNNNKNIIKIIKENQQVCGTGLVIRTSYQISQKYVRAVTIQCLSSFDIENEQFIL